MVIGGRRSLSASHRSSYYAAWVVSRASVGFGRPTCHSLFGSTTHTKIEEQSASWRKHPGQLKKPPTGADKNRVELATLWALAAAMALLLCAWGIQNRRAGYQRPPRRALLEEGFRLLRSFEDLESLPPKTPAPASHETSVDQLVNLSLAVRSAAPELAPELVEDSEAIHSPT
jgi:hypothetical protein